jgi:hypothetical protein
MNYTAPLNEQVLMFRAAMRELCALCDRSSVVMPGAINVWWQDERRLIQAEQTAAEAVKTAKRQRLEADIARLQAELAGL